jgi:hypothetical protein
VIFQLLDHLRPWHAREAFDKGDDLDWRGVLHRYLPSIGRQRREPCRVDAGILGRTPPHAQGDFPGGAVGRGGVEACARQNGRLRDLIDLGRHERRGGRGGGVLVSVASAPAGRILIAPVLTGGTDCAGTWARRRPCGEPKHSPIRLPRVAGAHSGMHALRIPSRAPRQQGISPERLLARRGSCGAPYWARA